MREVKKLFKKGCSKRTSFHHKCSVCIVLMGLFLIVMGFVTAVMGARIQGGSSTLVEGIEINTEGGISSVKNLVLMGGVMAILSGLLAILTGLFQEEQIYIIRVFIAIAVSMGVVLLVAASMSLAGYDAILKSACEILDEQNMGSADYQKIVDRYMCSSLCKCGPSAKLAFQDLSDQQLKIYGRKKQDGVETQETDFANVTQMIALNFMAEAGQEFKTFEQCYKKVLKPKEILFEKFADFKALEEGNNCASVCKTPLFSITRNVINGPVQEDCISERLSKIPDKTHTAWVSLVTSLLLLSGGIGSLALCKNLQKQKELELREIIDEEELEKRVAELE